MKSYYFLIYCAVISFISCSEIISIDDIPDSTFEKSELTTKSIADKISERELNTFLNNEFITVSSDTLKITIGIDEARNLGYSTEIYKAIETELIKANMIITQMIKDFRKNPSVNNVIVSFEHDSINTGFLTIPPIKMKYEGGSSTGNSNGWINTSGSETATQQGWAPYGSKNVSCQCFANVALGAVHIVSVDALGDPIIKSRVGNGSLKVPLDASNIFFHISYATTDSNGGKCSWRCVKY